MKLLLFSTLVTSSLAGLLIPREQYLTHTLMKNGITGRQCDDCCDAGQKLENGMKITFFGVKHDEYWPCANGLISFRGQVEKYTPEKFPIANQPVVAAFWGDVDLRRCREDLQMRCSYFKTFYGADAGFLNAKISRDFMDYPQIFTAKVAIVQTWDRVGYYDRRTNKENTFQIVIVSDGFDNTFAGMYYDKITWTTGDDSQGVNGLGGIQAQMGFDDGDRKNFYAHEWSRTADVIKLDDKEFIYPISKLKICGAGEELDANNNCIPRSCAVQKPFPILDIAQQKPVNDDGTKNDKYVEPPVLVGDCAKHLVNISIKVDHGTECSLKCKYDAGSGVTYQPKDLGTKEETDKGVMAKCDSATWVMNAAQNCVPVGIEAKVSNADNTGLFSLRESADSQAQTIKVKLKSKPYTTTENVILELRTSCKNGQPLKSRASGIGGDKEYYCNDGPNGAESKPLAEFVGASKNYYVTTLLFNNQNWNVAKTVDIKGVDNTAKSDNGFENFKVFLSVRSANGENCNSVGCSTTTPYTNLPPQMLNGKLIDNENLELKALKDKSLISDETGTEAMFYLQPVVDGNRQYVDQELTCTSSNLAEGKLVAYSFGDVKAYLDDGAKDLSKLGDRKDLENGGTVKLTDKDVTFYVKGQKDGIVDGPKKIRNNMQFEKRELRINLTDWVNKRGHKYSRHCRDDVDDKCQQRNNDSRRRVH